MSIRLTSIFPGLVALFLLIKPVDAQVLYGSVIGTVTDQSGAIIPTAKITMTHHDTGLFREATADSEGRFLIQSAEPGDYELKVVAPGFRTATRAKLTVTINTVIRVPIQLELGLVTEQINVQGSTVALQTDKSDVHVELGKSEVISLPLPQYRNYQSLLDLVPGSIPGRYTNSPGSEPARSLVAQVNGTNYNNNITKLDGAVNFNIDLPHHVAYVAPAETVETVNISTNSFDAEQGVAGGAAVTVVTKSGTNSFHGSIFAFHENSALGAKNFFFLNAKTPKNLITIPGVTAGGPIRRNKLFFFASWEGARQRQSYNTTLTVSTPDQRAGDFSAYRTALYDPTTGASDGSGRTPLAGNLIPSSRQSAVALKMNSLLPLPNLPGITNNYFVAGLMPFNRDNYDAKLNWNRTDAHSMFLKLSIMTALVTGKYGLGDAGGPCACSQGVGDAHNTTRVVTLGQTWTLSPRFLWDASFGWSRLEADSVPPDLGVNFGLETLRIPGTNGTDPRVGGIPNFAVSGYASLGNTENWNPYFNNGNTTWSTNQNFGLIKRAHDIRFGFEGNRHNINDYSPELSYTRGSFAFNQTVTSVRGAANDQFNAQAAYLLGLPATMAKSMQWEMLTGYSWQFGWFFRDRWQATRNLTVSLGVRYELYPVMTRAGRGGIEWWDSGSNMILLGGAGGIPKGIGVSTSHKLFAPRAGLAYRVNSSTVIRAGYGLTYIPLPLASGPQMRGSYPLTIAQTFTGPNTYVPYAPIEQGIPAFAGPEPGIGQVLLPPTVLFKNYSEKHITRGYIQSWNFIFEKKLPADLVASVGYVGTVTINDFGFYNANAAAPGTGTAGQPFFAAFGRTADTQYLNGMYGANYHSMQATINRRLSNGLMLKGAYTFSKAINITDNEGGVTFNYGPARSRNRALAGYDTPHVFQIASVYELPFGSSKARLNRGIAAMLLGGWQINGLFSSYSGRPFTITADGGTLNAPGNTQTADQMNLEVAKIGSLQQFYDKSAFAPVRDARFGTTGRNILRGPGVVNLNMGLFRNFAPRENLRMEFRVETFNFTNTPHFNNPSANASNANFMQITSAATDQRTVRFGLRLAW